MSETYKELLVEAILSHRISIDQDKYEYQVKIKNTNSLPWVAEYFLNEKESSMLNNYKKTNGLTAFQAGQVCDELFDGINNLKHIAFDFNEKIGIKLEVGIIDDFESENVNELQKPNVNIKLENVESVNVDHHNSNGTESTVDEVRQKSSILNEMVKEADKVLPINNDIKENICKSKSQSIKNLSNETKQIKEHETKPSEIQTDSVAILTKNSNQGIHQSLMINPQSDNIDVIFANLPRGRKISFETRDPTVNINLKPLSNAYLEMLVENGEIEVLQSYIFGNCKEKLQSVLLENQWVLVLAAQLNHIHIVATFLSLGVDINFKDSNSKTALMRACENENEALIDLLVNNGADMNMKRDGSNNILFQCITKNKLRAISTLLNLGVNSAQIRLESPFSMEDYAKHMKLEEVSNIVGRHNFYLYKEISDLVSSHLGPNIKLVKRIMPIFVLSQNDIQKHTYQLIFDCDVPPVKPNYFTMLSLVTGLILGNGIKFMINDMNKIKSLRLNNFEQKSFLPEEYYIFTSFSPLRSEQNTLTITSHPAKCKKLRLILVAYEVAIVE